MQTETTKDYLEREAAWIDREYARQQAERRKREDEERHEAYDQELSRKFGRHLTGINPA